MRVLSLCSGIGGLDLGIRLAVPTARTVCYVEKKQRGRRVLASRIADGCLDPAPMVVDLQEFDGRPWFGEADCIAAGFPCQRFSTASRGRGVAEDLWPECLRVIRQAQPRWVFLENVQRKPIEQAAADLKESLYSYQLDCFRAADVGAPHVRPRWWLLAHAYWLEQSTQPFYEEVAGIPAATRPMWWQEDYRGILGVDARPPGTMGRLDLLGNAVVPAVAARAWCELERRLRE